MYLCLYEFSKQKGERMRCSKRYRGIGSGDRRRSAVLPSVLLGREDKTNRKGMTVEVGQSRASIRSILKHVSITSSHQDFLMMRDGQGENICFLAPVNTLIVSPDSGKTPRRLDKYLQK